MDLRIAKWIGLVLLAAPLGLLGQSLPATDALGRELPTRHEVGDVRADRFVGMFYWTWHNHFADSPPYNVSELQKLNNGMFADYDHPSWPKDASYYHWGEPLFGYYRSTDRWVLRRHAEMLADAGVDVVVFDCTNGSYTWEESYMALCDVFAEARKDGVKAPQIAFMLGFAAHEGSLAAITKIYQHLYARGLYRDLWFQWQGKPLIMAYFEHLEAETGNPQTDRLYRDIRQFFTFRPPQPVYDKGPQRDDHWGWLEIYPQHGFAANGNGGYEQVTVGVAQNWTKENGLSAMNAPGAFGRSYTHEGGHPSDERKIAYGLNFQEQWDRALEIDPEFVFVTGWNEWVAGRAKEWSGTSNAFPDLFDQEHSRDIEPMKGGHGDAYYYQLVSNIRRFKGADPLHYAEKHTGIRIDGDMADWATVALQFDAHRGNTKHREEQGWGDLYYRNTTGRNDIIGTKATFDENYVYFLVETAAPLTAADGPAWMNLLIDVDRDQSTGWEGYDFIVNRVIPRNGKAVLERHKRGWKWKRAGAVEFAVAGNQLELRIDRNVLGITGEVDIEFKWTDNVPQSGDILDFYQYGDVAPLGRFNYYLKAAGSDE